MRNKPTTKKFIFLTRFCTGANTEFNEERCIMKKIAFICSIHTSSGESLLKVISFFVPPQSQNEQIRSIAKLELFQNTFISIYIIVQKAYRN